MCACVIEKIVKNSKRLHIENRCARSHINTSSVFMFLAWTNVQCTLYVARSAVRKPANMVHSNKFKF